MTGLNHAPLCCAVTLALGSHMGIRQQTSACIITTCRTGSKNHKPAQPRVCPQGLAPFLYNLLRQASGLC